MGIVSHQRLRVLPGPKPTWLRRFAYPARRSTAVEAQLEALGLHTICQEARCPNRGECFDRHTATFLILGDRCTRDCRYCAVAHGPGRPVDPDEPGAVACMVQALGIRHAVITSVTRDDLQDGGASQFVATVAALRATSPGTTVELLIPELCDAALATVLAARPEVLNHNLETVARLFSLVRPGADYQRSLALLARAAGQVPYTKSGLMVGLGESPREVEQTLRELAAARVQLVTIGQYLPPSARHYRAERWVEPAEYEAWASYGLKLGIERVVAGPLVRSSYKALEMLHDRG